MARPYIRIGTRGSELALWQACHVSDLLEREHGCDCELVVVKTEGDRIDDVAFSRMEGKGFFTKEIEQALLEDRVDLAVHSLKDLMTLQPDGLHLAAVGFRADRRELLLMRPETHSGNGLLPVRDGATIGTSSARRVCQIAHHAPSLQIRDLRGNVPTRVQKLRDGHYDAIVIAAAGVERLKLDLSGLVAIHLDPAAFLPAPGQGILALQTRRDDADVTEIVARLNDPTAAAEAALERGLLARFDSGCSLPLGVYCEAKPGKLRLQAVLGDVGNPVSGRLKRVDVSGREVEAVVTAAFESLAGQ